jgi:DNA polymerase I
MISEKKLFLLDAYALIFRAYFAFISRPIKNSKGLNTSAIFGFVNSLDELLRKEKPTHIAVAFDPPSPTFRHHLFSAYKANRLQTPEDIKLSIPYIKKIIQAYNIAILEVEGYEADDVIGTVSKTAHKAGYEVFMMTPDKDYAQLVADGIYMYKPRRSGNDNEIWGPAEVMSNFEISNPEQVIDILALWGDASDNIPGAPGIGEKTAKKLISEFNNIDNLIANIDKLKGKQKESIENNIEQIKLSKELATIDIHVPINIRVEELIVKEPNRELLKAIFNDLEFKTLAKRILGEEPVNQMATQGSLFEMPVTSSLPTTGDYEKFDPAKVNYILIENEAELEKLIERLKKQSEICFDTETTGLNVLEADIVGLSVCCNEKEAYYIPFNRDFKESKNTLDKIAEVFANEQIKKIGHNLKFDCQILNRYGITIKGNYFDTMVAHYLIQPERRHKLDILTEELLNYKMISIEELIGKKGSNQLNMSQILVETVKDYACEDADFTFRLYNLLKTEIEEKGLSKLAAEIEMPLIKVLTDIELAGFNIDTEALKEYEKTLERDIKMVENEIFTLAGEAFNIASPKQLGIILFEKLKISSDTKMTKTKQYSTGEEILSRLRNDHPIVNKILDYRTLTKLQSTYVTVLPKLIDKKTGRIHTSFNQVIAATGRLSSINPNLQNIPIRDDRGREIRKSFIPAGKDYVLVSADYSQIELRVMAHMSNDQNMIEAFSKGEDIHRSTAAKIFKVDDSQVTREMRSKAKTANFGIIYGISAFGLSQRLNIPRSESKELIDSYFISFPKVREYMDRSIEEAKMKGYVSTIFGRRRYLPDIHSSNAIVRGVAERNAINSPIQGSAADIIKLAMIRIHEHLKSNFQSKMILQVHDELVFDVFEPELERIIKLVKNEMENAAKLKVPLEVELGTGKNWLEAH